MHAIETYRYSDYAQWEGKWELIDGVALAMSPAPGLLHQAIAYQIAMQLGKQVEDCEKCLVLGEADWKISENTVLKPDVVLICDEPNENYMTKSPELIVEVISPSTAQRDEKYKFDIYQREKVPFYLLAYPDECKVKLFRLKDDAFSKEGDFFTETYRFEGLSCDLEINFDQVFKRFR